MLRLLLLFLFLFMHSSLLRLMLLLQLPDAATAGFRRLTGCGLPPAPAVVVVPIVVDVPGPLTAPTTVFGPLLPVSSLRAFRTEVAVAAVAVVVIAGM